MTAEPTVPEEEREIWREMYDLHEEFHEGGWTPRKWERFAGKTGEMDARHRGHPLMRCLLVAMYEYFNEAAKREAAVTAEQTVMEGIR